MNELAREIKDWRESKGFKTPSSIDGSDGEDMLGKLMLVVTETAEAAEAVRYNDLENFKEELADIFIRCLDICGTMEIDIEKEINKKMDINKDRPHLHGKETTL